ncbi:chemotaxis protein CheW [Massilia dura]|uniref:Chemotaxis protein CheW n=1 Tax=Pseudoduganella dura TaxID=321982 RepID=A0A6I3XI60_9BURK|nr:chemotaxis protein CheW [Pseudoduganella dura]MUI15186.1 chemotaxis protein CheW [Pseudoduganella dura]GGY16327.1 chemotaxis protein CheW [Pseudoduganella dura]
MQPNESPEAQDAPSAAPRVAPQQHAGAPRGDEARQYLTFRLGGLEYALDYSNVQELRPLQALERFATDGEIISGVAVSRGIIMPIVDMRIAFGPRPPEHDPRTDVIILKLSTCVMGMVTDGVTDIVTLAGGDIKPIPDIDAQVANDIDYLLGLAESGGRRLVVVDIDRLMAIRRTKPDNLHAAA